VRVSRHLSLHLNASRISPGSEAVEEPLVHVTDMQR